MAVNFMASHYMKLCHPKRGKPANTIGCVKQPSVGKRVIDS
jgi:hypothetical protein